MYFVSFRILNISKYNLFHLLCKQKTKNSNNMKRKDNTLTRIEFQVMSILWDINSPACGHDILERYDEPKPSYTTIATYMRILYEKGFVDYFKKEGGGKTQWYIAKITRAEYTRMTMETVKKNFFDGNLKSMFSYFLEEENLSIEEMKELLDKLEDENNDVEL